MAQLGASQRRQLPDSAFAYIDSRGRRRLPIHDEAHVRNALSRFSQVVFDDPAARNRARTRLLRAAKRHGIVPIGFIDGQLRAHGTSRLPTGTVTFLMTDVVDSTGLLHRLGDRYAPLLRDLRRLIRVSVRRSGGIEVDARADEYFAVFKLTVDALDAALAIGRAIEAHAWPDGERVQVRAGIHVGRPTLTEDGYVGIAVHAVSRICSMAGGGQIIVSRATVAAVGTDDAARFAFGDLGLHRLKGMPAAEPLYLLTGRQPEAMPTGAPRSDPAALDAPAGHQARRR